MNRLYPSSNLDEKTTRKLVKYFAADMPATQAAQKAGVNIRSVNPFYMKLSSIICDNYKNFDSFKNSQKYMGALCFEFYSYTLLANAVYAIANEEMTIRRSEYSIIERGTFDMEEEYQRYKPFMGIIEIAGETKTEDLKKAVSDCDSVEDFIAFFMLLRSSNHNEEIPDDELSQRIKNYVGTIYDFIDKQTAQYHIYRMNYLKKGVSKKPFQIYKYFPESKYRFLISHYFINKSGLPSDAIIKQSSPSVFVNSRERSTGDIEIQKISTFAEMLPYKKESAAVIYKDLISWLIQNPIGR